MNIYDFSFKDSYGEDVSLSNYKNKVLLLVNTATKCGLAPQFKDLEALHNKYKDRGLVVIGFPCNQFLNQEPETNENMANVCQINFGVTFMLSEKINVNGDDTHPLFVYLKKELRDRSLAGLFSNKIKWNFTKFLVDRNGMPYKRFSPTTEPLSMKEDIEKLLG